MENERTIGNITRINVFFITYGSYHFSMLLIFLIPFFMLFMFYMYKKKWYTWMSADYFSAKLAIDTILPFFTVLFFN